MPLTPFEKQALLTLSERVGGPLLGIESSSVTSSLCGVGWRPGEVWERTMDSTALPSDVLAETLWERLKETGMEPGALKGVVVGIGPGSFTGIRVGLATAKGLALGAGVPIYGISSLAVLALCGGEGTRAVVVDARQGEVYSALYRVSSEYQLEVLVKDGTRRPEEFAREVVLAATPGEPAGVDVVGDAASWEIWETLEGWSGSVQKECVPDVGFSLLALSSRLLQGDSDPVDALSPQYMRLTAAERNLKGL